MGANHEGPQRDQRERRSRLLVDAGWTVLALNDRW
jgi:hypothetical protein